MQIQINTDDHIEGREALSSRLQADVTSSLSRFSEHLTRVEVHLSDANAGKAGTADKRCLIEARPTGQQPVSVSHQAATINESCSGALRKLQSLLDSKFGQMHKHKGGESIRDAAL